MAEAGTPPLLRHPSCGIVQRPVARLATGGRLRSSSRLVENRHRTCCPPLDCPGSHWRSCRRHGEVTGEVRRAWPAVSPRPRPHPHNPYPHLRTLPHNWWVESLPQEQESAPRESATRRRQFVVRLLVRASPFRTARAHPANSRPPNASTPATVHHRAGVLSSCSGPFG
jgi:hypothetical protein